MYRNLEIHWNSNARKGTDHDDCPATLTSMRKVFPIPALLLNRVRVPFRYFNCVAITLKLLNDLEQRFRYRKPRTRDAVGIIIAQNHLDQWHCTLVGGKRSAHRKELAEGVDVKRGRKGRDGLIYPVPTSLRKDHHNVEVLESREDNGGRFGKFICKGWR